MAASSTGFALPGSAAGTGFTWGAAPAPTAAQTQAETEIATLNAQAAEQLARQKAAEAEATGKQAEATAYGTAAGIATEEGRLEQAATQIARFQQTRLVDKTVGAQRAAVAASGFKEAGSSLYLLRDSIQQGHITDALTQLQGDINTGGYLSQAAAALAAQTAASAASDADTILAQQYADAGALALADSANLTAELKPTTDRSWNSPLGSYGIPANATISVRGGIPNISGGRSTSSQSNSDLGGSGSLGTPGLLRDRGGSAPTVVETGGGGGDYGGGASVSSEG